MLHTIDDIQGLISNDDWMTETLKTVQRLGLPDWYIGAGFVRNKVWDVLHGYENRTPLEDIDVIYFDPSDITTEKEKEIEATLKEMDDQKPWSVKNQARMHIRNGDAPYHHSADAFSRWPETATCIGVRIKDDAIEVVAPHGVEDLVNLIVRPSPHFLSKLEIYKQRIASKRWSEKWPKLTFVDFE